MHTLLEWKPVNTVVASTSGRGIVSRSRLFTPRVSPRAFSQPQLSFFTRNVYPFPVQSREFFPHFANFAHPTQVETLPSFLQLAADQKGLPPPFHKPRLANTPITAPLSPKYRPDPRKWVCTCPYFSTSRFLCCKHRPRGAKILQKSNATERHRQV